MQDRAALAERVVQPWWYDALLGLLVAGFISSYSTQNVWVISGALLLLLRRHPGPDGRCTGGSPASG